MKPYGIEIDPKGLRGMGWRDYVLRFILGGGVTASAGVIAKIYGPVIGGLFLAFPAIFPASATLIEKHEIKKKAKAGFDGTIRGVKAASIDAAGAAIGTIGLALFALILWKLLGHYPIMGRFVGRNPGVAVLVDRWLACRETHLTKGGNPRPR